MPATVIVTERALVDALAATANAAVPGPVPEPLAVTKPAPLDVHAHPACVFTEIVPVDAVYGTLAAVGLSE